MGGPLRPSRKEGSDLHQHRMGRGHPPTLGFRASGSSLPRTFAGWQPHVPQQPSVGKWTGQRIGTGGGEAVQPLPRRMWCLVLGRPPFAFHAWGRGLVASAVDPLFHFRHPLALKPNPARTGFHHYSDPIQILKYSSGNDFTIPDAMHRRGGLFSAVRISGSHFVI